MLDKSSIPWLPKQPVVWPTYISVGVAAERLGVSRSWVSRLIRDGRLHAIKTVGGHRRILESEVLTLLAAREAEAKEAENAEETVESQSTEDITEHAADSIEEHEGR